MCSHLFFPASCSYSAVILEALQKNIRCSPRLSLTRFNIFYNLKNFKFHFLNFVTTAQIRNDLCFPTAYSWWVHGIVQAWWVVWFGVSLSLNFCLFVCLFICYSVLFPSAASQIVSARQQLYVPQREPKYPGNQASFSLWEPFFSLTLCIAFYFPLSASEHYKHLISLVSLWFHLKWSHSFFLQPAHLPGHHIDLFVGELNIA